MKRATLLAAAVATTLLGSTVALAQHDRHYRGYHGGHGGYYGWARPFPRYYYPYPAFPSPYYVAPYYPPPLYAPQPPVVVQRYSMQPAPPPPPQYSREERSYAQIVPPEPKRAATPSPAPRIERVTISAKEVFAFDDATLRSPQPRLDEIAELMQKHQEIAQVRITGYTDRIGTESYNAKLSQRRADAVKSYLVDFKGVAASRLVAVGRGEENPVVQCDDEKKDDLIKCLEPNRRVEVEEITVEKRVS